MNRRSWVYTGLFVLLGAACAGNSTATSLSSPTTTKRADDHSHNRDFHDISG